ncbi:primosomal replication protein PriC [Seminibacterium arietis]|uniref:Primosomal replication protein PriC n=1 Tax=Seminibacterium arietis TaxID=1173502 RepID=A0ABW3I968_9PAST
MDKNNLIALLKQKVTNFYNQYQLEKETLISAKFDRTLFSEDYQPFQFYVKEIEQTLSVIENLQDDQYKYTFYTQKLLAQCTALSEAITHVSKQHYQYLNEPQIHRKNKEQLKQNVQKLPPRERLAKYYDFLQALNDKIIQQEISLNSSQNEIEKKYYKEQIIITKQRRARCLEAIELLEQYLTLISEY